MKHLKPSKNSRPAPEESDCKDLIIAALRLELITGQYRVNAGQLQAQIKGLRQQIFDKAKLKPAEYEIDLQARRFVKKPQVSK